MRGVVRTRDSGAFVLATIAQMFASATTLAVTFAFARRGGPVGLSDFTLCFSAIALLSVIARGLITVPVVVAAEDQDGTQGAARIEGSGLTATLVFAICVVAVSVIGATLFASPSLLRTLLYLTPAGVGYLSWMYVRSVAF